MALVVVPDFLCAAVAPHMPSRRPRFYRQQNLFQFRRSSGLFGVFLGYCYDLKPDLQPPSESQFPPNALKFRNPAAVAEARSPPSVMAIFDFSSGFLGRSLDLEQKMFALSRVVVIIAERILRLDRRAIVSIGPVAKDIWMLRGSSMKNIFK